MSHWAELRMPSERELVIGLYDLRGYTGYCERTEPMQALDVMMRYHALVGGIIHAADGLLIKPIGDAGLFAFPADQADTAVATTLLFHERGDAWLKAEAYPGHARTVMHVGPAAIGAIGGPGRAQLDVIGKTVNIVGAMRTEGRMALTPALFCRLSPDLRQLFKKHTPPVSYIGIDDPRPQHIR